MVVRRFHADGGDSDRGCLTAYSGGADDFMRTPLQAIAERIAAGALHVEVGETFRLDEIVEAHRCMEDNKAGGKIVVLT